MDICSAVKNAVAALTIINKQVKSHGNYNKNAFYVEIDIERRKRNHHEIHRSGIHQNKQAFIRIMDSQTDFLNVHISFAKSKTSVTLVCFSY